MKISRPSALLEEYFAIFALILMMNAFVAIFTISLETGGTYVENTLLQGLLLAIYGITFALFILPNFGKFIIICRDNILIILISGLALLSATWSEVPLFTMQKAIALCLTTMFGLYLVMRHDADKIFSMLGKAFIIVLTASSVLAMIMPDIATEHDSEHYGNWRGVFPQKQVLGQVAALSTCFFFVFRKKYQFAGIPLIALSLFVLVMTKSRTAAIITACSIILFYLLNIFAKLEPRLRFAASLLLLMLLVPGYFITEANFTEIMDFLGRDSTLTGRTDLWDFTTQYGRMHPWLGYGYRSFWETKTELIFYYLQYYAVDAHNSFLNTWLELGFVGLTIIIVVLIISLKRSLIITLNSYSDFDKWHFIFFMYIIMLSLVASAFLSQNNYLWVLFVISYCYVNPKRHLYSM